MNDRRLSIFNKSGGKCWYCGDDLSLKRWHEDHFEPIYRGHKVDRASNPEYGEDVESNKVPCCAPCNLFKSVYSVEEFREQISLQVERARKGSVNFRTAERFGLIKPVIKPVVFWFEENVFVK